MQFSMTTFDTNGAASFEVDGTRLSNSDVLNILSQSSWMPEAIREIEKTCVEEKSRDVDGITDRGEFFYIMACDDILEIIKRHREGK